MVPMLTCGLVRSNLAFATWVPPGTRVDVPSCRIDQCSIVGLAYPTGRLGVCVNRRPVGLPAPGLLEDLLGDVPTNFGVVGELHRIHRTALGLRPQVPDVAEQIGRASCREGVWTTGRAG